LELYPSMSLIELIRPTKGNKRGRKKAGPPFAQVEALPDIHMAQPSPEQIAAMRQQFLAEAARRGMTPEQFSELQRQQVVNEAAKHGLTPEQFIEKLKEQAQQQMRAQMAARAQAQAGAENVPGQAQGPAQAAAKQQPQQHQVQQQVPVNAGASANPQAIAVANFLRSQNLKPRSCILDGRRRELFKVKRAIRALESDAYKKAQRKNPNLLPPVTDRASAENTFKLLPLSLLALRVSKVSSATQHNQTGGGQKRVKGFWNVKIEQHQEVEPLMHYVWLYDGPQWKQKVMAVLTLLGIIAVVMFPLWPVKMRLGVWYLSMGAMGLLGLLFAMAIFRLILFCVTVFVVPPGLWLFPNLFEDVGFFESFIPVWGWQEAKKKKKKSRKVSEAKIDKAPTVQANAVSSVSSTAEAAATLAAEKPQGTMTKRNLAASVEDSTE
ncbi:Translocation protein S62, partial [Ascosphaera aggregata]